MPVTLLVRPMEMRPGPALNVGSPVSSHRAATVDQ